MSNFAFLQAVGRPETWTPSNCKVGDAKRQAVPARGIRFNRQLVENLACIKVHVRYAPRTEITTPTLMSRLAYNKLALIDAAGTINDLRVPPGNRLEKLSGDRAGQYSVRVNDQWRICFTWSAGGASNVEFVDYH